MLFFVDKKVVSNFYYEINSGGSFPGSYPKDITTLPDGTLMVNTDNSEMVKTWGKLEKIYLKLGNKNVQ